MALPMLRLCPSSQHPSWGSNRNEGHAWSRPPGLTTGSGSSIQARKSSKEPALVDSSDLRAAS